MPKRTYIVSFGIKKKQKKIDLTAFIALMSPTRWIVPEQRFGDELSKGDVGKGGTNVVEEGCGARNSVGVRDHRSSRDAGNCIYTDGKWHVSRDCDRHHGCGDPRCVRKSYQLSPWPNSDRRRQYLRLL